MIRKAFVLRVDPGSREEYIRRHNPIWPELEKVLFQHGVKTYSIFMDPHSDRLFGYAEIEDEARWNAVAETDVCRKWWEYMSPIMPSNPDCSPVAVPLTEVFHIAAGS
jgi:L-rhamnose mutarotase